MHALERKQGGSCPQGASQSCASATMEKKQESRLQTRSNGRRRQVAHRALLSHIPLQPWRKGDGRASQGVRMVSEPKRPQLLPLKVSRPVIFLHLKSVLCFTALQSLLVIYRKVARRVLPSRKRSGRRAGASPSGPLLHFQSLHVLAFPVT